MLNVQYGRDVPANAASIALAERLGAWRDDLAPRQDPNDIVFRHPP
jgi:hypothetical protein